MADEEPRRALEPEPAPKPAPTLEPVTVAEPEPCDGGGNGDLGRSPPAADEGARWVLDRRPPAPEGQEPWRAGVGISSRHEREQELGAGKWTEPARSLDEVRAGMPSDPIRQMRIHPQGLPWRLVLAVALALAIGGWMLWRHPWRKATDGPSNAAPAPAEVPTEREHTEAVDAAADAPEVTVWTDLEGARIELDGRDRGPAPTRVPVPLDEGTHELCLVQGSMRSCRSLTGEQLAQHDPYTFTLGEGGR